MVFVGFRVSGVYCLLGQALVELLLQNGAELLPNDRGSEHSPAALTAPKRRQHTLFSAAFRSSAPPAEVVVSAVLLEHCAYAHLSFADALSIAFGHTRHEA